ncbi:hypothetical protein KM176_05565 [Pseudooceanicola sp. CBS1P-1]|uniref:Uncharacterized protein n=1 Tax=Pseudooceanicola albus TaxID=2692189 RepID=A0A6L7FZ13_9RHOB|nr:MULTISPECIES: hypothetical protein [Pseudooceanicola]MBT9383320.1 hypothetical protein [Pseudooceanicola endophyticus]MXN16357.1 hypothetical protein [Pseudooceanicola albus]
MTITNTVRIGSDLIDISRPCDVVTALRKMQLKLGTGGIRQTVKIDGEEVTFQNANDARLSKLIKHYQAECDRASGARRSRYAKRFRFG